VSEGVGDEGIFVSRAVFIEIDPHVFVLVHHFGAEFQLVAVFALGERQFEVGAELEVFLVDVLKLLGQFVQLEAVVVVLVQQDVLSVYGRHVRAANVAPVGVHGHAFLLEGQVAFVRAFFTGLCVGCFPVELQLPEKVLAAQGEVHCALAFQAGIALVGAARLGFVDHFVFIGCFVVPFVGVAVAVFPVVAVVEDTLEVNLVIGVDFPVQGQRIALAFAGDVVLAHFVFVEHHLAVFVPFVSHLHVVASCGIVLIRGRYHQAQLVVEEAVAVREAQVQGRLAAHPVVSRTGRSGDGALVGRVLGDEVDAASDGVGIHIRSYNLVYLDGLDHVGGDKIELHAACLSLGRGDAVSVDGHGTEVGTRSAHLSETRFTLVILYVDTTDALQGVTDVRVGELAHLVGGYDVGDS